MKPPSLFEITKLIGKVFARQGELAEKGQALAEKPIVATDASGTVRVTFDLKEYAFTSVTVEGDPSPVPAEVCARIVEAVNLALRDSERVWDDVGKEVLK